MGESTIDVIRKTVAARGKCSKCGGLAADDFAACPFDGYCPAPDYHEREARALLAEAKCPAFTRYTPDGRHVTRCRGPLNAAGKCGVCGHEVSARR